MGEPDPKRVFVVHGRNTAVRRGVADFLRSIGLQPIEWNQAVSMTQGAAPFVGEVLQSGFSSAQAVLVLLTGDDEARLRAEHRLKDDPQYESVLTPQVRQNVLFEAGIAFATHPRRTVVCQVGEVRPFSDIFGRHLVHLNNSAVRRQELAERLESAGCEVDRSGTDWLSVGNFEPVASVERATEKESAIARLRRVPDRRRVAAGLLAAALVVTAVFGIRWWFGDGWRRSSEYVIEFNNKKAQGFYPAKVEGRVKDGIEEFRGDWQHPPAGADWASYHWMSSQDFGQKSQEFSAQGYVLRSVTTFADHSGTLRYLATWVRQ